MNSKPHICTIRVALLAAAAAFALTLTSACDQRKDEAVEAAAKVDDEEPEVAVFNAPKAEPLLKGLDPGESLELTESERFPPCHEIFEPGGELHQKFPLEDPTERAMTLFGCDPEAYLELDDGTRYVAYGRRAPSGTRAQDLRFLKFAPDGKLAWSVEQDRQHQGANFIANYRDGFIAPQPPHLDCAGTLWEGGTQITCVDAKTGEVKWDGRMAFWAGIPPQSAEDGLVVADLTALTRRYPYSGVEMAYQELESSGGRSGYYVTDRDALYFGPGRTGESRLVKYDLETLDSVWKLDLPERPVPSYRHVFPELDLLVFKADDAIYGIDTEEGKPRWILEIGEDRPSLAALGDTLFVLHRRPEEQNALVAVDPKTGARKWAALTPLGTLSVGAREGVLMLKAVKAVQRVTNLDELQARK